MSLTPGTRLGVYQIVAPIGAGGMGEVYRATDTDLKRQVALKVLPESFAADAGRVARFQREAEVLAALNHPHIAQIYGLERTAGVTALVMELVEGENLGTRIWRGPLPLDEALPIARQIAEALEAAHDLGIIHRDLKPSNIQIRRDGIVKVLDFGLAKALDQNSASAAADDSPTITSPAMTTPGLILGTAAYMAPEQAKGKPVDRGADVWALGAVLFEMLTGQRAFKGEDTTDTIVAVLWIVQLDGSPAAFLKTPFRESYGVFSPDGRWVTYMSDQSGRMEVYVRPFRISAAGVVNDDGRQWQVSTEGGVYPAWGLKGTEVYYLNPAGEMMAAPIAAHRVQCRGRYATAAVPHPYPRRRRRARARLAVRRRARRPLPHQHDTGRRGGADYAAHELEPRREVVMPADPSRRVDGLAVSRRE